jgi:two-component system, LytTR family, response regulator
MPDVLLRALIVDDEPPARARVRALLENEPDVCVVGECADGITAATTIATTRPNVVFLDVEMPEQDGFEMLQSLDLASELHVVFVTAYDHYALRAFEVHAADYLLKPFDRERFQQTVAHLRERIAASNWPGARAQLQRLLQDVTRARTDSRVVVKTDGRLVVLDPDSIDWIAADGNYARIHLGSEQYLVRETLSSLAQRLDPTRFARIHRSTIVNLRQVHELHPLFHGEYVIVLRSGARLTLSRTYREALREQFPGI